MTSREKGVLQQSKFCIKWKIERFFSDCEKLGDYYKSPVFLIPYSDKLTKWFLMVHPKGFDEEDKDYVSVFLAFESENVCEIVVNYQILLVDEKNGHPKILITPTIHSFKGPEHNWGAKRGMEQDFIKDEKNGILINDTMTILCEIKFPHEDEKIARSADYDDLLQDIKKGLQDYEMLFDSCNLSDVTFVVQNQRIHLHKAILSYRDSYFKDMFKNETEEERPRKKLKVGTETVEITDTDYKTMKELFRFLYSGKVVNIDKIAKDLLIAADKYDVYELKTLCELTLAKNLHNDLTLDTVIEYLKLAQICETDYLDKPVIEFAVAHKEEVFKISGFQDISNVVMFQIIQGMMDKE